MLILYKTKSLAIVNNLSTWVPNGEYGKSATKICKILSPIWKSSIQVFSSLINCRKVSCIITNELKLHVYCTIIDLNNNTNN